MACRKSFLGFFEHNWDRTHIETNPGMGYPADGGSYTEDVPDTDAICIRCGEPAFERKKYGHYRIMEACIKGGMLRFTLCLLASTDPKVHEEDWSSVCPFILDVPMSLPDPLGIAHAKVTGFVRDVERNVPLGSTPI